MEYINNQATGIDKTCVGDETVRLLVLNNPNVLRSGLHVKLCIAKYTNDKANVRPKVLYPKSRITGVSHDNNRFI